MNKIKKLSIFILSLSLLSNFVFAEGFVRENNFMNKTGTEKRDELKRWQAQMNLPVTGNLNDKTKKALYTENYEAYDMVVNPPTKGKWIVINKSRRTLTMYKGENSIGKYPVTLGT
ncbi:L,D-transpeptidase family protein, partial [Peptoniphilus rhinitidis]